MEIRPLGPDDLAAYRSLRLAMLTEFPTAFSSDAASFAARTDDDVAAQLTPTGDRWFLGAFVDGALVGSVGFFREPRTKVRHRGEVIGMYVRPAFQGRGVGRALLEALIRRAESTEGLEQLRLAVTAGNRAATDLYASLGFRVFGVEPRALKADGVAHDQLHMVRSL